MSYIKCQKCGGYFGMIGMTLYTCGCKPVLNAGELDGQSLIEQNNLAVGNVGTPASPLEEWLASQDVFLSERHLDAVKSYIVMNLLPVAPPQASSEVRERPNLLSSIPLATGRDSVPSGWTVDPAFLLEVRELLEGDERPALEAIEAVVLALNQLQTKRALALAPRSSQKS